MPQPVEKVQLKLDSFDRLKPAIFMAGFVCAFFISYLIPRKCSMLCQIVISPVLGGITVTGTGVA